MLSKRIQRERQVKNKYLHFSVALKNKSKKSNLLKVNVYSINSEASCTFNNENLEYLM